MFLLEGNIGVGKSTFLRLVQEHCPELSVIQEPMASWTSQDFGQSLLGNFYQEPSRWAYTIETFAMLTRVKDLIELQNKRALSGLMERSVYSGHYCFAKNGHLQGYFTNLEWQIYEQWFEFLVNRFCLPPQGFVYLRADADACLERIKKRNRAGEEGMTREYVEHIGQLHDSFLMGKKDVAVSLKHVPVLVLDASQNLLTNKELLLHYIGKVKAFMQTVQPARREQKSLQA